MRVFRLMRCFVALVMLATGVAGCAGSATSPSQTPAFSQIDLRIGDGAPAAGVAALTVNYTGWLYDPSKADQKGAQFDANPVGTPFAFTLGAGAVIKGWDQGVPGMLVGGVRRLVIPPSLAYGANRNSLIPPNATLVFDIELVSVQ